MRVLGLYSSVAGKARANAATAAGLRAMAGRWTPEKVPMGPADPILGACPLRAPPCAQETRRRQPAAVLACERVCERQAPSGVSHHHSGT